VKQLFAADSTQAVLADWVEFELIIAGRPFFTDALLGRADEVERDPDQYEEDKDPEAGDSGDVIEPEILQPGREERANTIWNELELRSNSLGRLYPFELTGRANGGWRLAPRASSGDPEVEYARTVYRVTLMMASIRNRHITPRTKKDRSYSALTTSMERQFQHISALAAPNLHGEQGKVFSFGWPRKDGSTFQDALIDLTRQMGRGQVQAQPPANSSGREKDGTVDLVTWNPFALPSVGDPVIVGQVASGANWTDKPVQMYLKAKFLKWFKYPPTESPLTAIFIPFTRHTNVVAAQGRTMKEAMEEEDRDQAATYGIMVDRFRLVELIGQGLGPAARRHQCEDPVSVLSSAESWLQACRDYCS
jgi:hypothetical protein